MRLILGTAAAVVLTLSTVSSATSADQSAAAAGLSWKRVDLPHSHQSLRGLDAVNAKVAWVAGDEGGVWRTTDGGKTWKDVRPDAEKALAFRDVEADSGDVAQVLSIGPRGQSRIYKTVDGGKSWDLTFKNAEATAFYDCLAMFPDGVHGLAMSDPVDGKFRVITTDDAGDTWKKVDPSGMPKAKDGEFGFAASGTCVVTAGVKDAWIASGGTAARVFHSTDYGQTWTDSSSGLPCRYNFTVAADPSNAQVVWTGCVFSDITHPGGIYRSNDGGASWLPYGRGLRNEAISWLTVDPADSGHILAGAAEGVDEMRFAPDADQDGIPDSEEAIFGTVPGDANDDGTQDSTQANVASIGIPAGPLAPSLAKTTAAGDYVVVEVDLSQPHNGSCARVSDLSVISTDQIALSNRMQQAAPTIRFILPDCQSARVNIRYSAVTSYPNGVLGSYSPQTPGDGTTLAWGTFATTQASVDGNGFWSVDLAENAFGNVYAPGSGAILFQGAPGKDAVFANGFD